MALRRLPVRIAIAVAVSVLFYCVAVEYPSWGHGKAFTKDRPKWQNEPALKLTDEDRLKVLTTLLEQNRQEIRFWQDKLFTISFLFTGLILGIVVFTLKQKPDTAILRRLAAGSCLGLCFFYFLYVEFAEGAISVNDYDLIGIQYGLKLSEEDQYLLKKQRIYGAGDPAGHPTGPI